MAVFQIKIMKALEDDADYKLKTLKENDLDNRDIEEMKLRLKVLTKVCILAPQFLIKSKQLSLHLSVTESYTLHWCNKES